MSPLRTIGHVLDSLTDIRPLMQRVQTLVAMHSRYAACIAPELAARSRISHELAGTVFLQADSAAIAAKLRNLAPRILHELRAHWPNLTGIHVGTQPSPPTRSAKNPPMLDPVARDQLSALGDRLPDGPLKAAITRISRR